MSDINPKYLSKKFMCPHCHVIAQHNWFDEDLTFEKFNQIISEIYFNYRMNIRDYEQKSISDFLISISIELTGSIRRFIPSRFAISTCIACNDITLWVDREIVHPRKTLVDRPNADLNDEIKALYQEAANIYGDSPN